MTSGTVFLAAGGAEEAWNPRDGGGCNINPSKRVMIWLAPLLPSKRMLPVSRARYLGSASCLIAQAPHLWLLGAVESAVYGPIRVSSSHSTLEGILPCLAHPTFPSPCSSLRFRAEFLPQPPFPRRARGTLFWRRSGTSG